MPGQLAQRFYRDETRRDETVTDFAGGQVVVFSAESPDRDTGNEDAAAVLGTGSRQGVLAVADGLGGRPGGSAASALALRHLARAVSAGESETGSRSAILDGIEQANQAILELGVGAATTLSVAEIDGGGLRSYQVGDSAILVVGQRGRIKLQTLSHSPVGYAVESGLMDESEALHHEARHFVSNMVGSQDMRIEVGSVLRLAPRDTVLLATDGLLDNLSLAEIVEIVRAGPLADAAAELARQCERRMRQPRSGEPSKPDDLTFLLYRPL